MKSDFVYIYKCYTLGDKLYCFSEWGNYFIGLNREEIFIGSVNV